MPAPSNASTLRHQRASLTEAENWGAEWTSADWDFLSACANIPAHELAGALGRSLYAIHTARQALANGTGHRPGRDRRQAAPQARAQATCATCWLQHAGECA